MGEKVMLFKRYNLQLIKITGMKINQVDHKKKTTEDVEKLKLCNQEDQELALTRAGQYISNINFFIK